MMDEMDLRPLISQLLYTRLHELALRVEVNDFLPRAEEILWIHRKIMQIGETNVVTNEGSNSDLNQ